MKTDFQRELDEMYDGIVDDAVVADAELAIDIATQFRALRERRGLSQREVAERIGRTQQAVSKIENPTHGGHNLAFLKKVVQQLDAVLDVTIVPAEDLDTYRLLRPPKPVLEELSLRQLDDSHRGRADFRYWLPVPSANKLGIDWPSRRSARSTDVSCRPPTTRRITNMAEWLHSHAESRATHA